MAQSLTTFVCKTREQAAEARDGLTGDGYELVFGPEKVDVGTTDMTLLGRETYPFGEAWVVIGKKPAG